MAELAKLPVKTESRLPAPTRDGGWTPFDALRREIDQVFETFGLGALRLPLARSVEAARPRGTGWSLALSTEKRIITLTGKVASRGEQISLEDAVNSLAEGFTVVNLVKVDPRLGAAPALTCIEAAAQRSIMPSARSWPAPGNAKRG